MVPVTSRCHPSATGQVQDKFEIAWPYQPDVYAITFRAARQYRARRGRRGAIYARFSSKFQHSIEDQIRQCRKWAEENDIEVVEKHVFYDERMTGRSRRREGFVRLNDAIKAREIDVVIVFTTSRLYRKTYQAVKFVEEEICDRRMRCVFVSNGVDTDDKNRWRELLNLHSIHDDMMVRMSATHIRAAHEGQLRNGIVFGALTYGYTGEPIEGRKTRRNRPTRKLIIDPETSKYVKQIFEWFVHEELSIGDIVRRLNEQGVIPPIRSGRGRWTYLIVRRILGNSRYIGRWVYGDTEAVWQNVPDYSRQFKRDQPLCEVAFENLRIIEDELWHGAQKRLAIYVERAGRRSKDGDRTSRPKVLNHLCFCKRHRCKLWSGGKHGHFMFCKLCRGELQPELISQLPRALATRLILSAAAKAITSDPSLPDPVIAACIRHAEERQKPDPTALDQKRKRVNQLSESIKFILQAPGQTDEDRAENLAELNALRHERAELNEEIERDKTLMDKPFEIPTVQKVREMFANLADTLNWAIASNDEMHIAAARRILLAITGGEIIISQQGERKPKCGWLRATFTPNLVAPVLEELGVSSNTSPAEPINVDILEPDPLDELAEHVMPLWHDNVLIKQIAKKVSLKLKKTVSRNMVTKTVAHWHVKNGLPAPDGRSRRGELIHGTIDPHLYQKISDDVMVLYDQGLLLGEIAQRLGVDRNTITSSVGYWHQQRDLPVPDGRNRRKTLSHKSGKSETA